jgi:hypothetical protein
MPTAGNGRLLVTCLASTLATGCTFLPSGDGPFSVGTGPEYLQIDEVRTQVICELHQFIADSYPRFANSEIRERLNPDRSANASLQVKTETNVGLTYFGIDLEFLSLERVVAFVNNRPGIFARVGGRASVGDTVVINIPQNPDYKRPIATVAPTKRGSAASQRIASAGQTTAAPPDCQERIKNSFLRLGLDRKLEEFFKHRAKSAQDGLVPYCMPRYVVNLDFVILLNASASLNPYGTTKILAPVNLFTLEFSPTHLHSLNVTFHLTDKEFPELCQSAAP